MANPKNKGTNLFSSCGAEISEAHYYRNVAKGLLHGLLAKNRTLTDKQKVQVLFKARQALTSALQSTEDGRMLLAQEATKAEKPTIDLPIAKRGPKVTPEKQAEKVLDLTTQPTVFERITGKAKQNA